MKYITSTLALIAGLTIATYAVPADKSADSKKSDTKPADTTSAKPAATSDDPVVAKGKNLEIRKSKVQDAWIAFIANRNPNMAPIPPDKRPEVEAQLLDNLIFNQLVLQRATAAEKTKAKETADTSISDVKKKLGDTAVEARIKSMGMTMQQYANDVYEQDVCQAVLEREVGSTIKVSDADIKKFYDDHPADFEMPEQVRAAHVLISTLDKDTQQPIPPAKKAEKEKLAKDIKARADKGEDFAKLAKEFSDDPGSKDKGGEYTFPRGQMVPEFEAAAFSMKPGQVSDLVETHYGYHIIKTLEKMPASKVDFEKAKPRIKDYLTSLEFRKVQPGYFDKLKKEANVEIVKAN